MIRVSVVILAYNRPHNVYKLVEGLLKLNYIDDIIILYGHKDYVCNIVHNRVINVYNWEENDNIYTLRRFNVNNFIFANNDCILMLDDDLLPSQQLLNDMIKNYEKNKRGLYGPQSRYCGNNYKDTKKTQKIYNIQLLCCIIIIIIMLFFYKKLYGKMCLSIFIIYMIVLIYLLLQLQSYNVIIPGLSMINKEVIFNVWNEMNSFKYVDIFNKVVQNKGNGEDLFFNMVYTKLYGNPTYVSGRYIDLDVSNGFSTIDAHKHWQYRHKFCNNLQNY